MKEKYLSRIANYFFGLVLSDGDKVRT